MITATTRTVLPFLPSLTPAKPTAASRPTRRDLPI
jgi:hypothetical protein